MSLAISTIISNDKIMVYLELWSVLMFLLKNDIEIQLLYDIKWFYWFFSYKKFEILSRWYVFRRYHKLYYCSLN